ncbi:hypothetical protein CRYUN_Cryun13aG0090300 [Craigia yunnanensis]
MQTCVMLQHPEFPHSQRKVSHTPLLEPLFSPRHHSASSLTTKAMAKEFISVLLNNGHSSFIFLASTLVRGVEGTIGVSYGSVANNLPPPAQVAHFLIESTVINRVRLFDTNPDILKAFSHTGIAVTVTVPNDQIPRLTKPNFAQQWVEDNIQPYTPATNIVRILVGNEVISTANKLLIGSLVPAMQAFHTALVAASLDRRIQVSTPHSLGILSNSSHCLASLELPIHLLW